MNPSLRTSILEVERKFCSLGVKDLAYHTGRPAFESIRALPEKKIDDVYYDNSSGSLVSAGVWVRQRNGLWEAKIKKGGDYTNSMFEEIGGTELVRRCVMDVIGKDAEKDHFGLDIFAALSTVRNRWIADDDFKIVLDTMDFGHTVGEVELQENVDFAPTATTSEIEQLKRETMKKMDKRIEEFMDKYSWAFHLGVPKGKLTAYFDLQALGKTKPLPSKR
jgi:thiamine-triphosphatase